MTTEASKPKVLYTRNGYKVIIHDMNGKGSFPIKGTIMRKPPRENRPLMYTIWMANGQHYPLKESEWDLVLEEV